MSLETIHTSYQILNEKIDVELQNVANLRFSKLIFHFKFPGVKWNGHATKHGHSMCRNIFPSAHASGIF